VVKEHARKVTDFEGVVARSKLDDGSYCACIRKTDITTRILVTGCKTQEGAVGKAVRLYKKEFAKAKVQ